MNIIELHEKVWKSLQERRSRLPHALLLIGEKGLGKFLLAREFANSLLCEQPGQGGDACGHCLACNWFAQGNHPDFRLLQPLAAGEDSGIEEGKKKPSQQITIDQIRELDEFFNVGTHRGGLRVILINPTEAMNRSAANSLLKVLEEPNPDTLFLLVSSDPIRLLPTIRSRCQVLSVSPPAPRVAQRFLADRGVKDSTNWLALAGGSPLLACELAESGQGSWLDVLVERLAVGGRCDPLALATEMDQLTRAGKGRVQLKQIVEALQKWLIDLSLARNGLSARYFLKREATIRGLADMIPGVRLIHAYRSLIARRQQAEQPVNARLFLEGMFLDYRDLFARQ